MPVRRQVCGFIPVWRLNSEFFIYTCAAVSLCLCGGKFAVFFLCGSKVVSFIFRLCGDKFMPVWLSN